MAPAPSKRKREDDNDNGAKGDSTTSEARIAELEAEIRVLRNYSAEYYASNDCLVPQNLHHKVPQRGKPAQHVKERIIEQHELDNKPRLNTSSYVNVVQEREELDVAELGLSVNLADGSVYPSSVRLHDTVVNMIAQLWNCPAPPNGENFAGAGTVGSTEACLLAGLAHKFRWRQWYGEKNNLTPQQVQGIVPNMVISSCYQAAWEKWFRYFDVTPRFVKPTLANKMRIDAAEIADLIDDKTIMVVGILGNHYNGAYDPIWDMNDVVEQVNKDKGLQVGIHIDAASGGFIAPFQDTLPAWDFSLNNVLSISASGHKFGESTCGTGWVVFRQRKGLSEHIAVSVTYLGGHCDSYTLNFSRPATGVYVQLYKLLRLGIDGYTQKVSQQMAVTKYFRDWLKAAKAPSGEPRFEILDAGDKNCLPVVAARLNPALHLKYNDTDLQHAVAEYHWYVSGYSLNFEDISQGGKMGTLCSDITEKDSMFRIVVKSNLTMYLAEDLKEHIKNALSLLDESKGAYKSLKSVAKMVKMAQNGVTNLKKAAAAHTAC